LKLRGKDGKKQETNQAGLLPAVDDRESRQKVLRENDQRRLSCALLSQL
jgi:hypothetical protein